VGVMATWGRLLLASSFVVLQSQTHPASQSRGPPTRTGRQRIFLLHMEHAAAESYSEGSTSAGGIWGITAHVVCRAVFRKGRSGWHGGAAAGQIRSPFACWLSSRETRVCCMGAASGDVDGVELGMRLEKRA